MADGPRVVVVGGAAVGSSIAFHLGADPAFDGTVEVLEADLTYERASTTRSAASIRQQFSHPLNIALSQYGIAFLREAGDRLAVGDERPDVGLVEGGYLFLATEAGRDVLAANHATQVAAGADIALLEADGLGERFPWLSVDGIAAGCLGLSGEGWFDGAGLLDALRRKATDLGAVYRQAAAERIVVGGQRVVGVELSDGATAAADVVVCAAGATAARLLDTADVSIPVTPRKRMVFAFTSEESMSGMPLVIDPTGVWWRPEGDGYIAGLSPPPELDPPTDDLHVDRAWFDERIWPRLVDRVPSFDRVRVTGAWAGHYAVNHFDHNAIVGPVEGVEGLHLANGFSGHGLQQAPGVGRALAELIAHGAYRTLDLSPFHHARIAADLPVLERNIV